MIDLLKMVPLFNQLNDDQLQKIHTLCKKNTYPAGTVLFKEKDIGNAFYILISGSVKIYTSSQSGEDKILTVFKAGDSFGELSLIDGKPRSASAETLEKSTMYAVTSQDFLELIKQNFDISLGLMRELAQRLRETNEHVHDLTFLDAKTRVIKNLILLANKNGVRQGMNIEIKSTLNYDELSRMAGVSQKILIEVMRDLQDKKLITFLPQSIMLDLSKLRR